MSATLIQQFATSLVRGMLERADALSQLDHKLLKGELRELLVSEVLRPFLTHPFETGSGIVVNQRGQQSRQTDVIVYDATVLPPFVKAQHLGVYPAECVLATVEVKSELRKEGLLSAEDAAKKLHEKVYSTDGTIYPDDLRFKPICTVFGFKRVGLEELGAQESGRNWLEQNCPHVSLIALAGACSWVRLRSSGWRYESEGLKTGEEIKRFVALLLDNVRSLSWARSRGTVELNTEKDEGSAQHKDWLSAYIRVQQLFSE